MFALRTSCAAAAAVLAFGTLAACSSSTSGSGNGSAVPPVTSSAGTTSATTTAAAPTVTVTESGSASQSAATSSSAATTSTAPTTHPVPSRPLSVAHVTYENRHYTIEIWAMVHDADCAAHAYGAVQAYLRSHPCRGLERYLATTRVDGIDVGIVQSRLSFGGSEDQSYSSAGGFNELVTKNGTGNLDDLFRDGYRLPQGPTSVPTPDAFFSAGQDAGVIVTESFYLDDATPDNDPKLVQMMKDIFLQF